MSDRDSFDSAEKEAEKQAVMKAIEKFGASLKDVPARLRDDESVAMKAIEADGDNIDFVSDKIWFLK